MGYYTRYTGEIVDNYSFEMEQKVATAIAKLHYYDYGRKENPNSIDEVIGGGEHKWYNWREDMTEISKMFPNLTILIEGEGEEQGDIWKAYFRNGKCAYYKAKIVFDPFSEKDFE